MSRRTRACGAFKQDETGGGHVEAEPEQRHDEQQRRKNGKVERAGNAESHQQHEQRNANAHGQQHVEGKGRHRHDQNRDHA
jgi:hypothetical protein